MLLAISVSEEVAMREQPFNLGVQQDFFADGVTGKLPRELVSPFHLLLGSLRVDYIVVCVLQVSVVPLDDFGDTLSRDGRWGKVAD